MAIGALFWVGHGLLISSLFDKYAHQMYMDEPFHVPQTQHYCHGRLDVWDPKITTLPGLYAVGAVYAHLSKGLIDVLALISSRHPISLTTVCATTPLRFSNVVAGWACLILLYKLHRLLHPSIGVLHSASWAVTLAMFPLHWFFQFVYYSDVLSLTVVLAAHLACLRRSYIVAAVLAAMATLVRQTNVVWAVLQLGVFLS